MSYIPCAITKCFLLWYTLCAGYTESTKHNRNRPFSLCQQNHNLNQLCMCAIGALLHLHKKNRTSVNPTYYCWKVFPEQVSNFFASTEQTGWDYVSWLPRNLEFVHSNNSRVHAVVHDDQPTCTTQKPDHQLKTKTHTGRKTHWPRGAKLKAWNAGKTQGQRQIDRLARLLTSNEKQIVIIKSLPSLKQTRREALWMRG